MPIYEFEGNSLSGKLPLSIHAQFSSEGDHRENCYIGPGPFCGDFGYIEIGDGSNVQENVVIHTFPEQTARLQETATSATAPSSTAPRSGKMC